MYDFVLSLFRNRTVYQIFDICNMPKHIEKQQNKCFGIVNDK